ncbi:N-terminal nucleophile aminohydrolase [Cristinia sonorae]|uniref:N-terminal nucleophile aminohydrolase n=1 Tax=Cristinia sonorae TaxID=1940300 RepID=A0A8K0XKA1_9AGAR|nr:N-terminal nucleophile aminohydrolase [Cristinia sonorae]
MCRWFAYISDTEECLLEDVLVSPAHALSKQVHDHYLPKLIHHEPDRDRGSTQQEIALRNKLFNADGLGVAWYGSVREQYGECQGPRPSVYKIVRQPLTDPNFLSICAHTSTLALFAHIRAASGETAITEYNAHPFHFGRWCFMHNGVVAHFNLIKRQVCAEISHEAFQLIRGTTDSEHLAALTFSYLEAAKGPLAWDVTHPLEDVKAALEKAISKIIELQKQVVPPLGIALEASSLNVAITDGTQLLAIRFRNHPTEHPPSLYFSTKAGIKLNRKFPGHPDREGDNGSQNLKGSHEHGNHIIICSEPTTYKDSDWELVEKNECITVGPDMVMKRVAVQVAS